MIHDQAQPDLPWASEAVTFQRCTGRGRVYRIAVLVDVVGGVQVPCPECNGKGTVQAPLLL